MQQFIPHKYQRKAIQWIIDKPEAGLFLDMGLGKTVITLTALRELIYNRLEATKTVIIAPKRVVEDTWTREHKKWEHLQDLRIVPIIGNVKTRIAALHQEADIYLISRDNIAWLVDYYGVDWPYDCIVIDELSSFKSHATNRFKSLRKVRPKAGRVIGLTGTPAPNGYLDLWSQLYLLDQGERLGRTITSYRHTYFNALNFGHFTKYDIRDGAKSTIDEAISDICISMTGKDYLDLPKVQFINRYVGLSDQARNAYETMKRETVLVLNEDIEIIGLNAAAVMNKLMQIASGIIYSADQSTKYIHDHKLEVLEELIDEALDQPVLVFYNFEADKKRILDKFKESRVLNDAKDIQDWNDGNIKILVAHPASCGHGLNLQEGGHIIIWYGLTWSLELYQQANARLNRQGQTKPVMIYHIVAKDTIDERVLTALESKETTQKHLIEAVKAEIGV